MTTQASTASPKFVALFGTPAEPARRRSSAPSMPSASIPGACRSSAGRPKQGISVIRPKGSLGPSRWKMASCARRRACSLRVKSLSGSLARRLAGALTLMAAMSSSGLQSSAQPLRTKTRQWSRRVTETSDALDLEPGVFQKESPREIAESLKRSADQSRRRKADPFRSAMSMLTFYINRAGRRLDPERRRTLEAAKDELRIVYGRAARAAPGRGRPRAGEQIRASQQPPASRSTR